MSNDSAGRTPRSTAGGAPMGSTVAIVVTAIAVVLGFLILKKVNDDGDSSTSPATTSTTLVTETTSTIALNTTTTAPPLQKTGTKVQVANAAGITGVAAQMSTVLSTNGFEVVDPTNAADGTSLSASKVIYNSTDPNALAVAQAVAATLGNIAVEQSPAAPPVKSGAFAEGSGVVLLLGTDLAGKTLEQIQGTGTTTTVAVTAVPPAST